MPHSLAARSPRPLARPSRAARRLAAALALTCAAGASGQTLNVTSGTTTIASGSSSYNLVDVWTSLVQTGGTLTAQTGKIGSVGSEGKYTLSDGSATFDTLTFGPIRYASTTMAYGTLVMTGGTLQANNLILSDLGSYFLQSRVYQSGGTLTAGGVKIGSGYGNNAAYYLSGGTLATGGIWGSSNSPLRLLYMSGGTIRATANNDNFIDSTITTMVGGGGVNFDTDGHNIGFHGVFIRDPDDPTLGAVTKSGAGTLTLYGASTFTGGFNLQGGTLSVYFNANLGDASAPIRFTGGTLRVNGTDLADLGSRALNTTTFDGGFDIADAGHTFTLPHALSGTGALTKSGPGTLVLSSAGTRSGLTTVSAGTLRITDSLALQNSVVNVAGGTLDRSSLVAATFGGLAGSTDFLLQNGPTPFALTLAGPNDSIYAGVLSGTGSLTKSGTGTQTLTGANTYSGGTTLAAGALAISSLANLGAGPVNFSGGTLRIDGTALADLDALSFNASSFHGGFHIADAAHSVTLSQSLSGSGALRKAGAGTLVLSGANTFSGGIALDSGTLSVSSDNQLGSATNALAFNGGVLRVSGTSLHNLGSRTLNTTTFTGGFDIADAAHTFTVGHSLSGAGSLTKRGAGTLALSGSNTITGGLQLREGLVEFSTLANLGNGPVTLNGGGLRWAAGNTTDITASSNLSRTIEAGGATFDTHGNNVAFSAALSGSGALVKSGAGTLTLNAVNTHTGGTVVNGGNLVLAAGGQVGALRGALTINPGATVTTSANNALGWGAGTKIDSLTITGGTLNNTAANSHGLGIAYTLNGATLISNGGVSDATAASRFAVDGASSFHVSGATPSTLSGRLSLRGDGGFSDVAFTVADGSRFNITAGVSSHSGATLAGPVGIIKNGSGILALTGANTYTGNTTVNGGLVEFNSASALGASNRVILNGGGLRWASGTSTDISARLNPLGAGGGTFDTNGNHVSFATALSGSGALTKSGAGTLTLTKANTYSGGTVVNAGTLAAGHANAFGSGSIRVNAGVLDFGGFAIANTLDVRGGSLTGLANYAGTQSVSGSVHYTGTIGGTLTVASGGALDTTGAVFTGATTVQSGGSLRGSGTVGSLTIQSGGTLAPGNSPGLLTINGSLTLDSGSFTTLEIAGLTRGAISGYDAFNISGVLNAGGTLSVSFIDGFVPSGPATFDFFNFTSFGGSFAQVNLPTVAGYTWNTSQLSFDGTISLVASAIPEPATFATVAGLGALAATVRRRRHRSPSTS